MGNWLSNAYNTAKNWLGKGVTAYENFKYGYNPNSSNNQDPMPKSGSSILTSGVLPGGSSGNDAFNAEMAALKQQNDSLAALLKGTQKRTPAYTRTMADFWDEATARSTATSEFDPYYAKLQSEQAAKTQVATGRAEQDFTIGSQIEEDSLNRWLEQAGVTNDRAKEDAKLAMAKIAADKGMTRAETAYDRVRQNRQLVSDMQSKGIAFGGMAKQAGGEASRGRQLTENRVNAQYAGAESATALTESRQLQDVGLATKGRQAENTNQKAALNLQKSRTIEDIQRNQAETSYALEEERKYKIEQAVNSKWQQAYDAWDMDLQQFRAQYGI